MQHAPNIDLPLPFDVEDQVWELLGDVKAQAGDVQIMSIARRAAPRVRANPVSRPFYRVDELQRNGLTCLGEIVLDSVVDVLLCPLAKD